MYTDIRKKVKEKKIRRGEDKLLMISYQPEIMQTISEHRNPLRRNSPFMVYVLN